jgi:dihydroneopterin aldolase
LSVKGKHEFVHGVNCPKSLFLLMLTIELTQLLFNGHHGFYEEEKILGSTFEVNAVVQHTVPEMPVRHIHGTIDYTMVFEVIKARMEKPTQLLETLATTIAREILEKFPQAQQVSINIKKINPPIIAFRGIVGVTCVLKRGEMY